MGLLGLRILSRFGSSHNVYTCSDMVIQFPIRMLKKAAYVFDISAILAGLILNHSRFYRKLSLLRASPTIYGIGISVGITISTLSLF